MRYEKKPEDKTILVTGIVVSLVVLLGIMFIPNMLKEQRTLEILNKEALEVLSDAKMSRLEEYPQVFEQQSGTRDVWNVPVRVTLTMNDLSNEVAVISAGRDRKFGTGDDLKADKIDIHVRKSVLAGIESGARSFGKGMTDGVKESLSDTSDKVKTEGKKLFGKLKGMVKK